MKLKRIVQIVVLKAAIVYSMASVAQNTTTNAIVIDGDTIPLVYMRAVEVVGNLSPEAAANMAKYAKLRRDVLRAYPYAKLASAKMKEVNDHIATLKTERERKKYVKSTEGVLKEEFEKDLKNLTIGQGRILIKLVDRETGNSTFALIKEYRGGFQAVMWQGFAKLFGSNLKSEYDPEGEDAVIEAIVKQIETGQLPIPAAYMNKK
ncbi:MAG: DUF4294 domain-containing protein [Bacteroidetes bacterium]|nr:DUF4294 domain-containing protein [Bacteroidota bacterium]